MIIYFAHRACRATDWLLERVAVTKKAARAADDLIVILVRDVLEEASVPLGTGLVDISAALRVARETGVRHYYIEDEAESLRYLESVRF